MCHYTDGDNAMQTEDRKLCDAVHREENYWRWILVALKCIINCSLLFEDKLQYISIIAIYI